MISNPIFHVGGWSDHCPLVLVSVRRHDDLHARLSRGRRAMEAVAGMEGAVRGRRSAARDVVTVAEAECCEKLNTTVDTEGGGEGRRGVSRSKLTESENTLKQEPNDDGDTRDDMSALEQLSLCSRAS